MIWQEFKIWVEEQGVKDTDYILDIVFGFYRSNSWEVEFQEGYMGKMAVRMFSIKELPVESR